MKIRISAVDTHNSKIPPIKAVRTVTGLGLKEAKDLIDQVYNDGKSVEIDTKNVSVPEIKREFDFYGVTAWEVIGAPSGLDKLDALVVALDEFDPSMTVGSLLNVLRCAQRVVA